MFSKSKRFGDNVHAASGPGPAAYNIKRLFDASRAQQSNRVRKPQALPLRPLRPVLLGNRPKNRNEPVKVNSKNAAADDSNWLKVFACKDWLATGATGMVFAGTLIPEETPAALKRIREQEFDQKMVDEFFREFAILKACGMRTLSQFFRPMKRRNRLSSWSCWENLWTNRRRRKQLTTMAWW